MDVPRSPSPSPSPSAGVGLHILGSSCNFRSLVPVFGLLCFFDNIGVSLPVCPALAYCAEADFGDQLQYCTSCVALVASVPAGHQVVKKALQSYGIEQAEIACSIDKEGHVVYEWYMI